MLTWKLSSASPVQAFTVSTATIFLCNFCNFSCHIPKKHVHLSSPSKYQKSVQGYTAVTGFRLLITRGRWETINSLQLFIWNAGMLLLLMSVSEEVLDFITMLHKNITCLSPFQTLNKIILSLSFSVCLYLFLFPLNARHTADHSAARV